MKLQEIQLSYFPNTVCDYKINSSKDAFDFIIKNWNLDTISLYEEFKIVLLNRNNNVSRYLSSFKRRNCRNSCRS